MDRTYLGDGWVTTTEVAPRLQARIADLVSASSALNENGRVLLERLRLSLHEMRDLRTQLTEHTQRALAPRGLGTGAGRSASRDRNANTRTAQLARRFGFTARESDVAALLAQGSSNAAIAATLGISAHTARHHTQHVLSKLGVHSRAQAGARLRD